MKRRILSIVTALALCLSLYPTWAFAVEGEPDTGLCKHHPVHTEECGYTAPTEGQPCGHVHTADCYTLGYLPGDEPEQPEEEPSEDQLQAENLLDCRHEHDEDCGYVPADPGTSCEYVCKLCPIEDLIAALPDDVTPDNANEVQSQLDEILALFKDLPEEDQSEINLSRCYELQDALALYQGDLPGTEMMAEEPEDKSGGWVYPYVSLVPKTAATYTAGDGTITWEPQLDGDTVVSGTLTLNGATITAERTGIQIPVPAVIVLEGTNTITVTQGESSSVDHAGIVADHYDYSGEPEYEDLTLRGSGSLTISSSQFGIIADGSLIIDGAEISVTTQADQKCIVSRHGDLTVRNGSTVYAKESGGVTNFSGGLCSSTGSLFITDSKVTAISTNGYAINAYTGDVRFTNSDVVAIGNVDLNVGEAPIVFHLNSDGIHFQISGGTLFAQNNSSTGRDIIYNTDHVTATDSAVIYYHGTTYYLIQNGDNIQYESCTYDESTGAVTVGNGYVMGNVEWNDNILFPSAKANKSLDGRNYDTRTGTYKIGKITIPAGMEAEIPSDSYLFSYNLINNGTLKVNGYFDNFGTVTNNGIINNYLAFYNRADTRFIGSGTFNNFYHARNFVPSETSDSMVINGLILNYDSRVSPVKWEYVAHGDTQTKYLNNQLITGTTSSAYQSVRVLPGAVFTIPQGCTVFACHAAYQITWDNLDTYLSIEGKIVVNGDLYLPPNATREQIDSLNLSGTGRVISFGSTNDYKIYYPVNVTGGSADISFAMQGETVTLTPIPGKNFHDWIVTSNSGTVNVEGNTFIMPNGPVTVTARYGYTVVFDTQGGSAVASQNIVQGEHATEPKAPTRDRYTFGGWYKEAACENVWNFASDTVTEDTTLYAKWNPISVTGVTLNPASLSLTVGNTAQLTATVEPPAATNQTVTWTSSNEDVATVDQTGKVTAAGVGSATITVTTSDQGQTATCTVTVTAPLTGAIVEVTGTYTYKGSAQNPTVTVTLNGKPLTKDTDYTVTCTSVNAGKGTVTINGKGNYTGSTTAEFDIGKAPVTATGLTGTTSKTYNGTTACDGTGLTVEFTGKIGADDVSVNAGKFLYGNATAGTGKTVTASGLTLAGTAAGNYALTGADSVSGAVGEITKAAVDSSLLKPQNLNIANHLASTYTFLLSNLRPSISGDWGKVEYAISVSFTEAGYYNNDAQIIAGPSGALNTLSLPILSNEVETTGQVGTVTVTVKSTNYEDFTNKIHIMAQNKELVTFGGVEGVTAVYNGQPVVGYTGTLTITDSAGNPVELTPEIRYTARLGTSWDHEDTPPTNVGTYSVVFRVPDDNPTYIGRGDVAFEITPASITIKADDKSADVGSAKPALTYTPTGLAAGDTLAAAPTLTCDADMNTAGRYPITASGAAVPTGNNYNPEITYVDGTLTVETPYIPPTPSHTHNWSTVWSRDSDGHWHVCLNGGCDIQRRDYAVHVYDNEQDAACNVCGYVREVEPPEPEHVHDWDSAWNGDSAHHWHECLTDGCEITADSGKDGYGAHVYDGEQDEDCNICGHIREVEPPEPEHVHDWDSAWSGDDTHHWHECLADGCEITSGSGKDGYGAHVYDDEQDEDCNICGHIREVEPPDQPDNEETKIVITDGISEVPPALKELEHLDTPEKITQAMRTMLAQTGVPSGNTAVYDVTLMVSTDSGATWTPATKDNFPAGGLTVTLPYPDGTNSSYRFTVVHMFTTSDFGKTPGDTETPAVTNTADGLRFTVTGLSPISVGWEQSGTPVTPPSRPSGGGGGSSVRTYAVTVEKTEHGKVTASRTNAASGTKVTLTVTPDAGYALLDLAVTDSQGNPVSVTDENTFTMPGRAVTVKASFAPMPDENQEKPCDGGADCPSRAYADLSTGTWYHEAVDYAIREGLLTGYGNGTFNPNGNLSRAMLAQILYNKAGRPSVNGGSNFMDVVPDSWYADAVMWAAAQGIVGGYGNGKFGPNDHITREQLAVMLWRYSKEPAATDKELHFSDADRASSWALEALRWATENGILNGKGNGILDPGGLASRAETAQIFHNLFNK